eukprot:GHVT01090933.1.p1 GENE.GHVT01090933.1~~GHVT01090933.1.p1  ORF type:complete len:106 (+),score=31.88 GHVT01090933.1:140-457(+)
MVPDTEKRLRVAFDDLDGMLLQPNLQRVVAALPKDSSASHPADAGGGASPERTTEQKLSKGVQDALATLNSIANAVPHLALVAKATTSDKHGQLQANEQGIPDDI